ncbi:MAG: YcaO-like family protein [Hyphomicrobiales bacterium]
MAQTQLPVEREVWPEVALERVKAIIAELGLTACLAVDRPTVSHVILSDRDGDGVGAGSGKEVHSVLGAHAEALEHLALDYSAPEGEKRLSCQEIARQPNVVSDGILRPLGRYAGKVPCVRLRDLKGGQCIWVPCALLAPNMASSDADPQASVFLGRYATNSGAAFGCTKTEALLHAVNEILERHFLSNVYLGLVKRGKGINFACAGKDETHAVYSADAEEVRKSGVRFSLAIACRKHAMPLMPIGGGCSYYAEEAEKRACNELQQILELHDEETEYEDERSLAFLRANGMEPLISLSIQASKRAVVDDCKPVSAKQQLSHILACLHKMGNRVYYREIRRFHDFGMVLQLYIPGLDRFHLIRQGHYVVPNAVLLKNASC